MRRRYFTSSLVSCLLLAAGMAHADGPATSSCGMTLLGANDEDNAFVPGFTAFGTAVAISGDNAMVGLPDYAREGVHQSGRVAVFACDAQTHRWIRTASLDPKNQPDTETGFGSEIALQGQRAAVGAFNAVRLYERTGNAWRPTAKLIANGTDKFIEPIIAYDGSDLAVVRAKAEGEQVTRYIAIYRVGPRASLALVARLQPPQDFGDALAMDNGTLVAGLSVYSRRAGKWRFEQQLSTSPEPPEGFPSMAAALHGHTILIGNPREGLKKDESGPFNGGFVYVFQRQHGGWEQTQRFQPSSGLFNGFGRTLALNGRYAVIGAPFPYGNFGVDFGPTFLYRTTSTGLAFDRTIESVGTSVDVSQHDVIIGTNIFVHAPISAARIEPLVPQPSTDSQAN